MSEIRQAGLPSVFWPGGRSAAGPGPQHQPARGPVTVAGSADG
jgi:hypothetical protein